MTESTTEIYDISSGNSTCKGDLEEDEESYPPLFVGVLCAVLVAEALLGLLCNVVVILVYHNRRSLGQVSNVLITNLSILDVVMCVTAMPLTMTLLVSGPAHHAVFCFIHEATASFASASTALNLLVISYDRFETIVAPFERRLNLHRVKFVLGAIWCLTFVAFVTPMVLLVTSENLQSNDSLSCYRWVRRTETHIYFDLYCIILYLACNTVMVVCYVRIFKAAQTRINVRMAVLKATVMSLPGAQQEAAVQKSHERTMTKMTLMIVFTFVICWGPHTLASAVVMVTSPRLTIEMVHLTCLTLAYSTPALHPLLYAFMRKNFRQELGKQLRMRFGFLRGAQVGLGDAGNQLTPPVVAVVVVQPDCEKDVKQPPIKPPMLQQFSLDKPPLPGSSSDHTNEPTTNVARSNADDDQTLENVENQPMNRESHDERIRTADSPRASPCDGQSSAEKTEKDPAKLESPKNPTTNQDQSQTSETVVTEPTRESTTDQGDEVEEEAHKHLIPTVAKLEETRSGSPLPSGIVGSGDAKRT